MSERVVIVDDSNFRLLCGGLALEWIHLREDVCHGCLHPRGFVELAVEVDAAGDASGLRHRQ